MNETKNKMVLLAEQLRELTHGICTMGPGPYGIGVSTDAASSLRAVLQLSPDPFLEENFGMSGEQECKAEMLGFVGDGGCGREYLSQEELREISQGDDPAARMVAEAVLRINESKPTVTVRECNDAFGILADWEINGQSNRSPAEQAFISSLTGDPAPKAGMEMGM